MKNAGLSSAQQNLSRRYFNVAITLIVVLILMSLLTDKLDHELENAERNQFELRLAELRSAVLLQEGMLVAKDQMDQAFRYEGANPMVWMEPEASYYLGEMNLESVVGQAGNWVYDPRRKVIAYKTKTNVLLTEKDASESKWLQFKVVALLSNDKGNLIATGLRLKPVENEQ